MKMVKNPKQRHKVQKSQPKSLQTQIMKKVSFADEEKKYSTMSLMSIDASKVQLTTVKLRVSSLNIHFIILYD